MSITISDEEEELRAQLRQIEERDVALREENSALQRRILRQTDGSTQTRIAVGALLAILAGAFSLFFAKSADEKRAELQAARDNVEFHDSWEKEQNRVVECTAANKKIEDDVDSCESDLKRASTSCTCESDPLCCY